MPTELSKMIGWAGPASNWSLDHMRLTGTASNRVTRLFCHKNRYPEHAQDAEAAP